MVGIDAQSMVDDSGVVLPDGFASIEQYAGELMATFNKHAAFPKINIVEFFVSRQWDRVPEEWRRFFDSPQFDISSLIPMASRGVAPEGAPVSLREYVDAAFKLRLPRDPVPSQDTADQSEIIKYFLDGMGEKKRKEVVELSQLIDGVARETGSKLVVDVGAGQGYLSRVLAYSSSLSKHSVLAVDFSEGQKRGAEALHQSMAKKLRSRKARAEGYEWKDELRARLDHRILRVDMDNTGEVVSAAQAACQSKGETRWMLCGLHACGNLSSAILKTFAESDAAAVVLVPCCYNHISEAVPEGKASNQTAPTVGFPLSQGVLRSAHLGIDALKSACQASGRWETDAAGALGAFKRGYHRALLHYLMVTYGQLSVEDSVPVVGKVTNNDLKAVIARGVVAAPSSGSGEADIDTEAGTEAGREFAVYALAALEKMKHAWRPTVAQCVECQRSMDHGLQQIAAVWTLKAITGPLVESLLIVDRALYLRECCGAGGIVRAFALFDVVDSPRNLVLVAQRANTPDTGNGKEEGKAGINC
ncbi:hypothetical protein IWW48_002185 [Coemansia sp. RSA 1200]|nr:hypothetical protein IWW48_002185 [Coemansia sp. RSA 1200]